MRGKLRMQPAKDLGHYCTELLTSEQRCEPPSCVPWTVLLQSQSIQFRKEGDIANEDHKTYFHDACNVVMRDDY